MSGMSFLAWRLAYQSDEQAIRAAYDGMVRANSELQRAKAQLLAIATAKRSNFEDSVEFQDWAASRAAGTLADMAATVPATPRAAPGITRSPGLCLSCKLPYGQGHTEDCYFAPFVVRRRA